MQTTFKFIATVALLLFGAMQSDAQVGKPHKRNLTVKEWNVDAGSTAKIMDHLTVYDNLGRKIEEAEYDRYGVKWRTGKSRGNWSMVQTGSWTIYANSSLMNLGAKKPSTFTTLKAN